MEEAEIPLDKDFHKDERLFHYTSAEGLYGILDSECLWATHFKFLNDSSEFFAARKWLLDFVHRAIHKKVIALKVNGNIKFEEGTDVKALCLHEAEVIVDAFYTTTLKLASPFIFSSFVSSPPEKSFRNGELLHWATYGRNGGYAIEMNPHKLALLTNEEWDAGGVSLLSQRAIYLEDDTPKALRDDFEIFGTVAQQMVVGRLAENFDHVEIDKAAQPFMRLASVIKDEYFKNEGEARLVAMRYRAEVGGRVSPKICVRQSASGAIPYIKLFEGRLFGKNCPIEAIIIGPHPNRERRAEALSILLESRGWAAIKVIPSEVPYLGA